MLSVEYFAAKDQLGLIMTVPSKCGLKQADTLRIEGLSMVALQEQAILPIELPDLTESVRAKLEALSAKGYQLPVGEFVARGLVDAYSLRIVII